MPHTKITDANFLECLEDDDNFFECLEFWISKYAKPSVYSVTAKSLYVEEPKHSYNAGPVLYCGVPGQEDENEFKRYDKYEALKEKLSQEKHCLKDEIATLMKAKHITKASDVYKTAWMSCALFKKIMRSDENYIPDKDTVFKLCIALQVTLDEANKLLSYAGYCFNPSQNKDIIVKEFIVNKKFSEQDQIDIDTLLFETNEKVLFSKE